MNPAVVPDAPISPQEQIREQFITFIGMTQIKKSPQPQLVSLCDAFWKLPPRIMANRSSLSLWAGPRPVQRFIVMFFLAILPSWFFPARAYELDCSCLACSSMEVDAHTCSMSHSHLQHTRGHAKMNIALPEGSQEARANSGWQRVASAITERRESKEGGRYTVQQGGCSNQVIHK